MKSYSDNDFTVFREYANIYNAKILLKNIIRIEFETFYNASQPVRKQTSDDEFNSIEKQIKNDEFDSGRNKTPNDEFNFVSNQTPNDEFNHNKSENINF